MHSSVVTCCSSTRSATLYPFFLLPETVCTTYDSWVCWDSAGLSINRACSIPRGYWLNKGVRFVLLYKYISVSLCCLIYTF